MNIFIVIEKFIFHYENWLSLSLMWGISFTLGIIVSEKVEEFINNLKETKELKHIFTRTAILRADFIILTILFFIEIFVVGIIFNSDAWGDIAINTILSFAVSLIIINI